MRRLHILIPLHDFSAGGTEVVAFRLAREWIAAGHRVTVLAGAPDGAIQGQVPAGADIRVLDPAVPRSALSRLVLGRAMAGAAAALAPDIVFIPGNFHFILARALRRALPGAAIVAKISNPLLPRQLIGAARFSGLMRWYLRPIDTVIAMNPGLEAELRALSPKSRSATITDPNVPDDQAVQPMRDRRARAAPLRLLLIGRLEPQKDIPLALRVAAHLRWTQPVHLTVLGEGYLRPAIEAARRRMGLDDHVALLGFVADIGPALDAADVLLITSRYEGGPAVAVEALAHGLPVVSTDCSHLLRSLLVDPRLGRLAPSRRAAAIAAAIVEQMRTPPAPLGVVEQAVEPSRYAHAADAYLRVFEELAGSKSL